MSMRRNHRLARWRDMVRRRGFETVQGAMPAGVHLGEPPRPRPSKEQLRQEAEQAVEEWKATRGST